jgi:hypothetical protein
MIFFSVSVCSPRLSLPLLDMHLCSLPLLCFMLYLLFPFYVPCLFSIFLLLHTPHFYPHESLSITIAHLFSFLCIFFMPSPLPYHHCNSLSSLEAILNLFITNGRYPEIHWPFLVVQPLVFSMTIELIISVTVTVFDAFPSVNRLFDESSFHW